MLNEQQKSGLFQLTNHVNHSVDWVVRALLTGALVEAVLGIALGRVIIRYVDRGNGTQVNWGGNQNFTRTPTSLTVT